METEMKNEPKLLSASTIKYMLKTPDSFRIKYSDLYIENYEFHEHLILGNAIHKVAEHYTNTNERKPQVGLDYIYEQLMNFDEGVDYLPEIVVEMETRFHNALKGLFEVKNETGLVEQKITLPDFK
jgi:hypothetical protein